MPKLNLIAKTTSGRYRGIIELAKHHSPVIKMVITIPQKNKIYNDDIIGRTFKYEGIKKAEELHDKILKLLFEYGFNVRLRKTAYEKEVVERIKNA